MDTAPRVDEPVYERLAYEAAQRALDKQEKLIEELRSRTGLLLAAASLAASFLGREAFADNPKRGLAVLALVAFLIAVGASLYVLLPKTDKFVFALVGAGLYEACMRSGTTLARSTGGSHTTWTVSGRRMTSSSRSYSTASASPR